MIIRDAAISDQRRTIGRRPRESLPSVPAPEAVASSVIVSQALQVTAEVDAAPEECLPLPALRESGLSFEAVAAWLAVQDGETRTACASILCDELIQVREAARMDGLAAGKGQAQKEAQLAADRFQAAFLSMVSAAEEAFARERSSVADLCVDIVAEVFSKIAGPILSTREAARGAVVAVLGRVKEGRELTIRVSPHDIEQFQHDEQQLAAALSGRKFSLVADMRVELGGCIVESKLGSLDGRLDVQLRELYETLRVAKSWPAESHTGEAS